MMTIWMAANDEIEISPSTPSMEDKVFLRNDPALVNINHHR